MADEVSTPTQQEVDAAIADINNILTWLDANGVEVSADTEAFNQRIKHPQDKYNPCGSGHKLPSWLKAVAEIIFEAAAPNCRCCAGARIVLLGVATVFLLGMVVAAW